MKIHERAPGMDVSGFTLRERVAEGNFCEVWRAEGRRGDEHRLVAIKIATTEIGGRMLESEAAIASRLEALRDGDPGSRRHGLAEGMRLVPILAHGTVPWAHVVMPWLGGGTFRDVLDRARSADARARAVRQLAEIVRTVAWVHDRARLAHGDLKPENILLDGRGRPHLADFGLAREIRTYRMGSSLRNSLSASAGPFGGTLAYLPPEGVKGDEPSLSGDVYALGIMLHEALLGRRPDKAMGAEELRALLPQPVIDVLTGALAFDPKDRCPNALVLREWLRDIEPSLTAVGANRWLRAAARYTLAGLAAFFVSLRYGAVLALVTTYMGIIAGAMYANLAVLLGFVPFLLLHAVIRWEGPETQEEANLRRQGLVIGDRR